MTITHQASTGINAATAQGSSSTGVAYVGVAAGRRALLGAAVYPETNSWNAVTGWSLVGELAGGATGADISDDHKSRLGVWQRDLDGSETGSVTVGNSGGGTGQTTAGAMSSYSTDAGGWDTSIFVSADDSGHGTNPAVTFGAWAEALQAGDVVVVWHASDTDNAGTKSAFSLLQTGITFGAITHRNGSRSGTGSDCAVDSWDAVVSSGTGATAADFSYTYATASCGPFIAVRLRESAGAVTLGQAVETDTATTLTRSKNRAVGQSSEADTATALVRSKARALNPAAEADTATAMARSKTLMLGRAAEADTATAVARSKRLLLGTAGEADTAGTLTASNAVVLGQAVEANAAGSFGRTKAVPLRQATESDSAGAMTLDDGMIHRPFTGVIIRPFTGIILRP
jgi:hypothetical protein